MTDNTNIERRQAVRRLLANRGETLVVCGLGSSTYDVFAAGDDDRNFYLWGALPKRHEVVLDKIFQERGFKIVSDLRIEEVATTRKAAWMVASFGMFYPVTYKLTGRVKN